MTRSNVLAVISFAVVFAAGFFVGQLGWNANRVLHHGGASLASQLELTPRQQEDLRKIWNEQLTDTASAAEKRWEEAEDARDAAVRKLLTPDQLKAYNAIEAEHRERAGAFRAELLRKQLDAEARTRSLLTPPQREKFDKLVGERGDAAAALAIPPGIPVSDVAATTKPKDAQAR
jgi:Spy/CpxP family protein refolding chaperone